MQAQLDGQLLPVTMQDASENHNLINSDSSSAGGALIPQNTIPVEPVVETLLFVGTMFPNIRMLGRS